jgi:hypothetical protein
MVVMDKQLDLLVLSNNGIIYRIPKAFVKKHWLAHSPRARFGLYVLTGR